MFADQFEINSLFRYHYDDEVTVFAKNFLCVFVIRNTYIACSDNKNSHIIIKSLTVTDQHEANIIVGVVYSLFMGRQLNLT